MLPFAQLDIVTAVGESDNGSGAALIVMKMAEMAGGLGGSEISDSLLFSCPATLLVQKQPTLQMLNENFHNWTVNLSSRKYMSSYRRLGAVKFKV